MPSPVQRQAHLRQRLLWTAAPGSFRPPSSGPRGVLPLHSEPLCSACERNRPPFAATSITLHSGWPQRVRHCNLSTQQHLVDTWLAPVNSATKWTVLLAGSAQAATTFASCTTSSQSTYGSVSLGRGLAQRQCTMPGAQTPPRLLQVTLSATNQQHA